MCIYLHDMKFLWSMLSLGQLYTDDTNDDANDDDTNDTWWTNHDYIGSLACMPNEPKSTRRLIITMLSKCMLAIAAWLITPSCLITSFLMKMFDVTMNIICFQWHRSCLTFISGNNEFDVCYVNVHEDPTDRFLKGLKLMTTAINIPMYSMVSLC